MSLSKDASIRDLDDCGACASGSRVRQLVQNRPGLDAIAYRVGTHAELLRRMRGALADARRPALQGLNTRETDDFSIALLDAFAALGDVLTFYQERIANEAFVRTATERVSIVELARLLGYQLAPGVAASAYLAFDVQGGAGVPEQLEIRAGVKVQSLPGPDEVPQLYEVIEPIIGRAEWNALRPRRTEPQTLRMGLRTIWLAGASNVLTKGDALLLIGRERTLGTDREEWDFRRVQSVELDAANDRTKVVLDRPLGWRRGLRKINPAQIEPEVRVLRQAASLFGASAPDWRTLPDTIQASYLGIPKGQVPALTEWPGLSLRATSDPPPDDAVGSGLWGEYHNGTALVDRRFARLDPSINFNWGTGSPRTNVVGNDQFSARWTGFIKVPRSGRWRFFVTGDDGVRLWIDGKLIIDDWFDRAAIERSSAERLELESDRHYDIRLEYYENAGSARVSLAWSSDEQNATKAVVPTTALFPKDAYTINLEGRHPKLGKGGWLVLASPDYVESYQVERAVFATKVGFGMSVKTTRLALAGENLVAKFDERVRDLTAYFDDERAPLAESPITTALWGRSIELDRTIAQIPEGRVLIVEGLTSPARAAAVEAVTVARSVVENGRTKLELAAPLIHTYVRDSVVIRGNVALSSHGETVANEVLGSGDPGRPNQSFVLKQTPTTFVSAATPSGRASTLEVRVDGVRWREVDSLLESAPTDRVFSTRADAEGKRTIVLGDGKNGARAPLGSENITALYRKGLGRAGTVGANKLTLLLSRPLGISKVDNPLPASGAEDPESTQDARVNAPLTVVALERVVSLEDYAAFARTFAGIAKAHVAWTWHERGRGVALTVSGPEGAEIVRGSKTFADLQAAVQAHASVPAPLDILTHRQLTISIDADVRIDADRSPERVRAAVLRALRSTFSFAGRAFGQRVYLSELIAVMQNVAGVAMVDVNSMSALRADGTSVPAVGDALAAQAPRDGDDARTLLGAVLLTIPPGDPLPGVRVAT
jgi:predicted phage baseplate assembly protein